MIQKPEELLILLLRVPDSSYTQTSLKTLINYQGPHIGLRELRGLGFIGFRGLGFIGFRGLGCRS